MCFLAGQIIFDVPDGWRITQIYTGGTPEYLQMQTLLYCSLECQETRRKAFVKLERTIAVGEVVEAPQGCKLTIEARKDGE